MDLAHLRAVTDESLAARAHPHGTVTVGEHYPIPRGVFVGEHTGAVVIDPAILSALLDVIDAAERTDDGYDFATRLDLRDALARFREVAARHP